MKIINTFFSYMHFLPLSDITHRSMSEGEVLFQSTNTNIPAIPKAVYNVCILFCFLRR